MKANKRDQKRKKTYAKVVYADDSTPGYLRDVSDQGCRISFIKPIPAQEHDVVELKIIPQQETRIPAFRLFFEICWVSIDSVYFSIGGEVSLLPEDTDRERYAHLVEFYKNAFRSDRN